MAMELKKFCKQAHDEIEKIMAQDDGFNQLETEDWIKLMGMHYFCQNLAMEHIWGEYRHITDGTPQSAIPHYENVHEKNKSKYLTDEQIKMWVNNFENEDGTTGEHWNIETTTNAGNKYGINFNEIRPIEFWLILNMKYSDMYSLAIKYNINSVEFYVDLVKCFINDKDTINYKEKLYIYYNHIAKK